jgi:WD40 repeat protein/tRNA A-37 threonylcarbamoyl transferase component Bud32
MTAPLLSPLPLDAVERVDEVCDRFEAAWRAGQQPQIDEYVTGQAGPERDALLRELRRVADHYRSRTAPAAAPIDNGVKPLRDRLISAGYEILGELGRGGMGVVYKARQLKPNRIVALKMISAEAAAGPRELERFRREADAVAQLQHPHIVQVYEVGEVEGHPYFALEYVAGGSLDQKLAGAPQPPQAAARLVEQLAHAIHHAHQRGIIHRDLKPANVLLVSSGEDASDGPPAHYAPLDAYEPKITDFGLAKLLDVAAGNPTQTTDLLGTPSYMAPEQVGGTSASICAATDVYGLGAILYELLTGRPPFRGETVLETVFQVQSVEPVSPSRLQPRCPRDLVTICLKCMHKLPHQRYATALQLAEDLRRFLDGQPIKARPVGRLQQALKWARRQPVVAGLAALLLLAVTIGAATTSWLWWQAEDGRQQAEEALANQRAAQAAQVATVDRYQVALAHRDWLANGVQRANALLDACTAEQRNAWEWRYLDRMRKSALRTFAGHENVVRTVAVHPLGGQTASGGHDGAVWVWNLSDGTGRRLGNHPNSMVVRVAYSPDGNLLASSDMHFGRIKLWDLRTGQSRELLFGGQNQVQVGGLAFHPSGRWLAAGGPRRVKVWDLQNHTPAHEWAADTRQITDVAFSPDGHYLATAGRNIRVWEWETNRISPRYDWPGHTSLTHELSFNREGTLLASGGRDGMIHVYSLEAGQMQYSLDAHQLPVMSVCFSPNGERLASAGHEGDMHVWDVKGRRRLFTLHGHSGAVWDHAYTPDGKRLVSAGGDFLVQVWDAEAGQESRTLPISRISGSVNALTYGAGGRFLAWGNTVGQVGICDMTHEREVFRLERPDPKRNTRIWTICIDPEGRHVAWCQADAPPSLWEIESAKQLPLSDTGTAKVLGVAFSADGRKLLGAVMQDGELRLCDLRTGREIFKLFRPANAIQQVVFSADARRFVSLEAWRTARLWDTATGHELGKMEHQPNVRRVAFSGNGRFIALGGIEGWLSVWDLTTNRQTMRVRGHTGNLHGLALSPDGQRIASCGTDCTAKLWNVQTGYEVLTLRTQLHETSLLAFSPDGMDIVSVNVDNRLQIWSADNVQRARDELTNVEITTNADAK